ncbi:MAG: FAD-binding oxidoreductase [Dongiaceae bacterium]
MSRSCDFLIIGGGISGTAAGYELAPLGKVIVLEREDVPGYHATGRSAALFTRNYGPALVRAVSAASFDFLSQPPAGFAEHPLMSPRGGMSVAFRDHEDKLDKILALGSTEHPIAEIGLDEALQRVPLLRRDLVTRAVFEPGVLDMDVDAIHRGFIKGLKARGGDLVTRAPVIKLTRQGDGWEIRAGDETYHAATLINAAGAWADEIGRLAGAAPIGLVPKRRTAILVDPPAGIDVAQMPMVDFAGGEIYMKPSSGKIMASPGDETPAEPHDIQPDDMDVAVLADWLENHTNLTIRRISHSWAGLRSFVADKQPVAGFDPVVKHFYWLAGQGGFGIMMASALARVTAGLVGLGQIPPDMVARGITEAALSPRRCLV